MKKYTYNSDVFTNEDDVSYYLLGAFMTDGCVVMRNGSPVRAEYLAIHKTPSNTRKKLCERDVIEIRQLLPPHNISQIARDYGVSWNTIDRVFTNQSWKHVKT